MKFYSNKAMRLQKKELFEQEMQKLFFSNRQLVEDNRRINSENQLLHQNNIVLENRYTALNHTYMDTIPMQNYYYATRQQEYRSQ